ncbi:MAG: HlyD family efflux transporter periplasmic adaptor subunit [Lachnospiraceae bacterium]|nr:HlyD family efflux transporter periplasmic adaptor subunit [Lachnospiraceae bacterium]
MNEKKAKRREWVKTAAIVFLSVMLVLTFFSNTIMNYSLPEVAAQYITSGTITAKIRGTGIVESGSLFNVKVKESRKVLSVEVRVGDIVEIGDIICYLDESESSELKDARERLEELQDLYQAVLNDYNLTLLTGKYSNEVIQNAGNLQSVTAYREQVVQLQNEIEAQQAIVDDWQSQIDALNNQIAISSNLVDERNSVTNAQAAVSSLRTLLDTAESKKESLEGQIKKLTEEDAEGNSEQIAALEEQLAAQENNVASLKKQFRDAQTNLENAQTVLTYKEGIANNELSSQMNTLKVNLGNAEKLLKEKEDARDKLYDDIRGLYELNKQYNIVQGAKEDVAKQQDLIAELERKSAGAAVTAEVAGTITSISVVAGENTSPDVPVAVIQPEGKGFTLSFSVTNQQAERISVGDPGELVNSWWYSDVTATVASIRPDPSNPNSQKLVTFNLTGNLTAGQSLSLQVGQRSSNYDCIVPNSAIREDNNGKFILVVETRNSPLGNRYYATRYDVEVLASDDTQSAVNGALYGYEYVITTSTKPVEAGQMVRLPD